MNHNDTLSTPCLLETPIEGFLLNLVSEHQRQLVQQQQQQQPVLLHLAYRHLFALPNLKGEEIDDDMPDAGVASARGLLESSTSRTPPVALCYQYHSVYALLPGTLSTPYLLEPPCTSQGTTLDTPKPHKHSSTRLLCVTFDSTTVARSENEQCRAG